jgi:DNA-binding transcriptional ArsR family regulator
VATPEEVTEQGCCVGVDAVVVAVEQVVGDQAVEALRDRARRLLEAVGVSRITASERLKKLRYAGLVEWTGNSPNDPCASWRLPST